MLPLMQAHNCPADHLLDVSWHHTGIYIRSPVVHFLMEPSWGTFTGLFNGEALARMAELMLRCCFPCVYLHACLRRLQQHAIPIPTAQCLNGCSRSSRNSCRLCWSTMHDSS